MFLIDWSSYFYFKNYPDMESVNGDINPTTFENEKHVCCSDYLDAVNTLTRELINLPRFAFFPPTFSVTFYCID